MKPTQAYLIGLLTLAASVMLAACSGDPTTAPDTAGVRAASGSVAHDEEPPPEPDGEFTGDDGRVYCRRGGLIAVGPCPVASELVLDCIGPNGQATSFLRGQSVRCAASATPASATDRLEVTDWTFVAADGSLPVNRHDNDPNMEPDSRVWEGTMVRSGTVTLDATVGGVPKTKSVIVTVAARDWANREIPDYPRPQPRGQGVLPLNPYADSLLGHVDHWVNFGAGRAFITGAVVRIERGPNAGLFFAREVPRIVDSILVFVNVSALTAHSAFWAAQEADNPNRLAGSVCTRSFVTSQLLRDRILAHEGLGFETGSHTERYRAAARQHIGPAVEGIVGEQADFVVRWDAALAPTRDTLTFLASMADTRSPVILPCTLNFRY